MVRVSIVLGGCDISSALPQKDRVGMNRLFKLHGSFVEYKVWHVQALGVIHDTTKRNKLPQVTRFVCSIRLAFS